MAEPATLDAFQLALDNPDQGGRFFDNKFSEINQGVTDLFTGTNRSDPGVLEGLRDLSTQNIGGIAGEFATIGRGGGDPRFDAFKTAQLGQLETDQQRQEALTSNFFSRRGLGGSSAALNALNNVGTQYGQQRQNMNASLGLQQLGRQDQALTTAAGLYGTQFGLEQGRYSQIGQLGLAQGRFGLQAEEQDLSAITAGLENLTLPYTLETERQAAGTETVQLQQEFKDLQDKYDALIAERDADNTSSGEDDSGGNSSLGGTT